MNTWRRKALELLPKAATEIHAATDLPECWKCIERLFYAGRKENDVATIRNCLRFAAWTLHLTPQALTISDVSSRTADLLFKYRSQLNRWIDRKDFMITQKGLRYNLGEERYRQLEKEFFDPGDR